MQTAAKESDVVDAREQPNYDVSPAGSRILSALVDEISAMLAYWDEHEICRFANRAYYEWFGVRPQDLIDKMSIVDLLGVALYRKNEPYIRAAYAGKKQVFERAIPLPSGGFRHSLITYYPHRVGAAVKGIFVHGADVGLLAQKGDIEYPVKLGPYSFDLEQGMISIGDKPVALTWREFSLARYFFSRPGTVISREDLCQSVLGLNPRVVSRTLDTHVSRMRQKLQLDGRHGVVLMSVYQRGYALQGG